MFVQSFLRLFGLFWLVGSVLLFFHLRNKNKQLDQFLESAISDLEGALSDASELGLLEDEDKLQEEKLDALAEQSDKLTEHFMAIGTALTAVSGLGLVLSRSWVVIPLCILVLSQLIYFILKKQLLDQVKDEEDKQYMRVQSSTINAFKTSLVISALSLVMVWFGNFQ